MAGAWKKWSESVCIASGSLDAPFGSGPSLDHPDIILKGGHRRHLFSIRAIWILTQHCKLDKRSRLTASDLVYGGPVHHPLSTTIGERTRRRWTASGIFAPTNQSSREGSSKGVQKPIGMWSNRARLYMSEILHHNARPARHTDVPVCWMHRQPVGRDCYSICDGDIPRREETARRGFQRTVSTHLVRLSYL